MLRRQVMPVAFIVALVWLSTRTCASEMAEVDLRVRLGDAAVRVQAVIVDVRRGETLVAQLKQYFNDGAATREFGRQYQLDPGAYELVIEVQSKNGVRHLTRAIHVEARARIVVDLEADLMAAPETAAP